MMKKAGFVIVLIVAVAVFTAAGAAGQPTGPRIFFEETEFDAPKTEEGKTVEHTFKVWNRGDQPLKIMKVKPG